MAKASKKSKTERRPKPVNYARRRTVRLDKEVESAVEEVRLALEKVEVERAARATTKAGQKVRPVDFSKALRVLIRDRFKAARALAGSPDEWTQPEPETPRLPREFVDDLHEMRDATSRVKGSLYSMSKRVNFKEYGDSVVTETEHRQVLAETRSVLAKLDDFVDRLAEGSVVIRDVDEDEDAA